MKQSENTIILSAHDLIGHLNCQHLTQNDLDVVNGKLAKPSHWDPLLEILRERGIKHEQAFLDHLGHQGFDVTLIDGVDITDGAVAETLSAMRAGAPIIVQAALQDGPWVGRADVLRRVEKKSTLGAWSYEIIDTKLARETKGATILQLSLYAELLRAMQGLVPELVYVVAPWTDFEPQAFRVADYAAFFRKARGAIEIAIGSSDTSSVYPDPKDHCDICRWAWQCEDRRRADDHLCLVANVSKNQIAELQAHGVDTAKKLAELQFPLLWKPNRGSPAGYEQAIAQARLQVRARELDERQHEVLDAVAGSGLSLLPDPSPTDIFFDIEGDPFVGEHGLEYLFGYHYTDQAGKLVRVADWAFDRGSEKAIFEKFMDFVTSRRAEFPDTHVYHYAPYEPGALKRLMGRYATRETEVDNLLRGNVLIDLYSVVRNGIRASVESYSIKKLEPFYEFERLMDLKDANVALAALQGALELNDAASLTDAMKDSVARYNDDDCRSTEALRNWLESIRAEAIASGAVIERPTAGAEGPSEEISDHERRVAELVERLTQDVPIDLSERTPEQHGRWILAYSIDWHRREEKAGWWEYFRLKASQPAELLDEKAGLGGMEHTGTLELSARGIPTDQYSFVQQDTDIRVDDELHLRWYEIWESRHDLSR